MDVSSEADLKAHLMQTDEPFRQLLEQHQAYDKQLVDLEAKAHLTTEEEVEEHRLKKLKLHTKDLMVEIMNRYKTQQVG
ncbi:MAG: YdcH family protein [Bryobacterales bacterium]|nr:YdcH family protein [Bryobacterales bacterium]